MNRQIAVGQVEKKAGVTPELVTGALMGVTTEGVTPLTPATRTRRRYKPRTRKCKCGCGQMVTPTAQTPHKVYFNDTCRKRDNRRKAAKLRPSTPPADPVLELTVCQYCSGTFLAVAGRGAKYCKPAHRTAAAEHRRAAAVEALMADMPGMGSSEAADLIENTGMDKISRYLRQRGFVYDERGRAWVIAVQSGELFAGRR